MGFWSTDSKIVKEKKKSKKQGEKDLKDLAATALLPLAPVAVPFAIGHALFGKKEKEEKALINKRKK